MGSAQEARRRKEGRVKPFIVIDAEQRSPEWRKARAGRLTASEARDVLATIKSGEAAARRDLRIQKVVERLTGEPEDDVFVNAAMQWGIDCEPLAFNAYEALTGQMAHRVGFLAHTELLIGCSPDGVIGDFVGGLEIKCPKKATHWGYLRGDQVCPPEYLPQILHSLWVTGAAYWDFLSFDPRFPPHLQTFYVRVDRSHVATELVSYIEKAKAFLAEVDREVSAAQGFAALKETA
jgi:hypothetical protein